MPARNTELVMSNFKPYHYQLDCLDAVVEDLKEYDSILSILPMSAGKTTIFCMLADQYIKETGKKVLILSDRDKITKQNLARMQELYPDVVSGILQADKVPPMHSKAIFSLIQTARGADKMNMLFGEIGLVIIDESHKSACESYDKFKELMPKAKYSHWTATPYKENQLMTKMYEKVSYSMSIQQLIALGKCVPPRLIHIDDCNNDTPDKVKSALMVKLYKEKEMGKKAAVFMRTISQCFDTRNAFIEQGIKCETVTSKTPVKLRDRFYDDFENGDLQVIITCNVISEGFDCPPLEVIFMPYSGSSVSLYVQRIGRALRKYGDKKDARIYAAGRVPSIKKAFYTALREGESKKMTVRDDLAIMDLFEGDMLNSKEKLTYTWNKDVCEIADILKGMGKLNLERMLIEKKFPVRLLKNLSLAKLGLEDGNFSDDMASFEKAIRRKSMDNISKGKDRFILPSGKQQGKHVKDTHFMYRRAHKQYCKHKDCPICKAIKDWFYYGIRG